MEQVVLKAEKRSVTGKQVRALRRAGQLPAVIYGYNIEPINISLDAHDASLLLSRTTVSSLVMIDLDGKQYPTLVRERQRNPIKNTFVHIDFQAVSMTEKIRSNVSIQLSGLSPAVKDFEAVLVTGLTELEVEALPQDLPERIVMDVTSLVKIGDGIYVRDIILSEKVKILDEAESMIVLATAPRAVEVEEEVTPEAVALEEGAEPEVVEKGKKEEGEETSEG